MHRAELKVLILGPVRELHLHNCDEVQRDVSPMKAGHGNLLPSRITNVQLAVTKERVR